MGSKIGLQIEVDGKMVGADMGSLAWMAASVVSEIMDVVDITIRDANGKVVGRCNYVRAASGRIDLVLE